MLTVELTYPIELDTKDGMYKVPRSEIICTIDVDFSDFVMDKDSDSDSDPENEEDTSVNKAIDNNRKHSGDDVILDHIYEPIRHIVAHHILQKKLKAYVNQIGKRVRTCFPYFILFSFFRLFTHTIFVVDRVVCLAISIND